MLDITEMKEAFPELEKRENVVLVNPNHDQKFAFSTIEFEPFVKYTVSAGIGKMALEVAERSVSDRAYQAAIEKKQYLTALSSTNPTIKDNAHKFCSEDMVPGGRFIPKSTPFKRPLLVDYNTEEGRRHILEGMQEAKDAGWKPAGSKQEVKETAREVYDDVMGSVDDVVKVSIEVPKESWDAGRLASYIDVVSGKAPPKSALKNKKELLKLATDVFITNKQVLIDNGAEVVEKVE